MKRQSPEFGVMELTHQCNFSCPHCYNPPLKGADRRLLPQERLFKIIDELGDMGTKIINVTGGEPTLREDFKEIYLYIVKKGIKVGLETNCSNISLDTIRLFKEYPPHYIDISLYGFDQKTFKKVTGSDIPYAHILKNVESLCKFLKNITVRTPITKNNFEISPKLKAFSKKLGCRWKYDPTIFWRQDGKRLHSLRATSKMVIPYIDKNPLFKAVYSLLLRYETEIINSKNCKFGINEFIISPYGELYYCHTFWNTKASLIHNGFKELWYNWYPKMRREKDNFCIAKRVCSCENNCPYGKFYYDRTIDMSKTVSHWVRLFIKEHRNINSALDELLVSFNELSWMLKEQ